MNVLHNRKSLQLHLLHVYKHLYASSGQTLTFAWPVFKEWYRYSFSTQLLGDLEEANGSELSVVAGCSRGDTNLGGETSSPAVEKVILILPLRCASLLCSNLLCKFIILFLQIYLDCSLS